MRKITRAKFLELYEGGLITETFSDGKIYVGRNVEDQAINPRHYEVVYADVV